MMVAAPLPRAVLARLAREVIESHCEWDSPHALASVYRDGTGGARYGTVTIIDPALHPDLYPALIAARASEDAVKGGPPYAFLLQVEVFGTTGPGEDASAADRALFEADRIARTFHLRKDAVEFCTAWVADAHGRTWSATKARGRDGIEEHFYRPGSTTLGGQMITALTAAARDYGSAE
jgi:hypothetical protein